VYTHPIASTAPRNPPKSTFTTWFTRSPVNSLIVWSASFGPPSAYAMLSLSTPWPGIRTLRSRGSDSSAIASFFGSSRIRIIVSERTPEPSCASREVLARRSEPISRIVCGLPGGASASSLRSSS
jgi:hypothetical protein